MSSCEGCTCEGCTYESNGLCKRYPPSAVAESGKRRNPQSNETTTNRITFCFPPATERCGEYRSNRQING